MYIFFKHTICSKVLDLFQLRSKYYIVAPDLKMKYFKMYDMVVLVLPSSFKKNV
jgi:hypothetical protein